MGPTLNADHTDSFYVPAEHGSELAARLPFDVWLSISQHLSIKDLAALRVVSITLNSLVRLLLRSLAHRVRDYYAPS